MSNTETKLLAADKIVGIIFLAICLGVGGTWLFQKRHHPVSLVVEQALKNSQEEQEFFAKNKANLPTLSFPQGNPLEGQFKAQEETRRRVNEILKANGIKTIHD